jgi:hypothetical protein
MSGEIAAAITSLKAAFELAKTFVDLHDVAAINAKVVELQGQILSAQASAFAANDAQSALLERVHELEQEVANLKAWEAEKEKYQLTEVGRGVFAYTLKEGTGTTEPKHSLCPQCYQEGFKAILQEERRQPGAVRILYCLRCHGELNLSGTTYPQTPRSHPIRRT